MNVRPFEPDSVSWLEAVSFPLRARSFHDFGSDFKCCGDFAGQGGQGL
jgi:hypothetical protein